MCVAIAVVSPRSQVETVRTLLVRRKIGSALQAAGYDVAVDPPLERHEMVVEVVPWSFCHCGTPLGNVGRPTYELSISPSELRRLRSKGWGDARIHRWYAEKAAAVARRRRTDDLYVRALTRSDHDTTFGWLEFIRDVASSGIPRLGIVVSWEACPRSITRREEIRATAATALDLHRMEYDVLYSFTG